MLALASAFEMVVTPYGLIGSSFSNSAKSASNYSLTVSSFIIGTAAVAVTSSGASSSSSSSSSIPRTCTCRARGPHPKDACSAAREA